MSELVIQGKFADAFDVGEGQIRTVDDRIAEVATELKYKPDVVVKNGIIFPGFIDTHVHLREPGATYKEDFFTGTLAAAHGGVTTCLDMPNNKAKPTVSLQRVLEKQKLIAEKAAVNVGVYGGINIENLQEIPKMAPRVVGYKIYQSETTDIEPLPKRYLEKALALIAETHKPVSFHCEDQAIVRKDRSRPKEAELKSVKETMELVEKYKLRAIIAHCSLPESFFNAYDSRKRGLEVYAEFTPHHIRKYSDERETNPLLHMNPPLRDRADMMHLRSFLCSKTDGILLGTDHAPHTLEEKQAGAAGVPNLDVFGNFVGWLLDNRTSNTDFVKYLARITSYNASQLLGFQDRGRIEKGYRADLTAIVFEPEIINARNHFTRCRWSPYEGEEFPARTLFTLCGGNFVYKDFTKMLD